MNILIEKVGAEDEAAPLDGRLVVSPGAGDVEIRASIQLIFERLSRI